MRAYQEIEKDARDLSEQLRPRNGDVTLVAKVRDLATLVAELAYELAEAEERG